MIFIAATNWINKPAGREIVVSDDGNLSIGVPEYIIDIENKKVKVLEIFTGPDKDYENTVRHYKLDGNYWVYEDAANELYQWYKKPPEELIMDCGHPMFCLSDEGICVPCKLKNIA